MTYDIKLMDLILKLDFLDHIKSNHWYLAIPRPNTVPCEF